MKNHSLFRYLAQGAVLLTLTALTVVLLEPIRAHIAERMEELRSYAIDSLEEQLGRRIRYDSIAPSIVSSFEIRGLEVLDERTSDGRGNSASSAQDDSSGTDSLIRFDSILIRYRVIPLLLGRPEQALSEFRLRNTDISVDLDRDSDLLGWLDRLVAGEGGERERSVQEELSGGGAFIPERILPEHVTISTRNLNIRLSDSDGYVEARNLNSRIDRNGEDTIVSVRTDINGEHAILEEFGRIDSEVSADVRVGPRLEYSSGLLDLRSLSSDRVTVSRQQFRLQSGTDLLSVRKVGDTAPVDIALERSSGTMELNLSTEEYRFSDLVQLRGDWAEYDPWLASPLSGEASVEFDGGTLDSYRADFSTTLPESRIGTAVSLDVQLSGDAQRVRIPVFRATTSAGRALFAGSIGLDDNLPEGSLYLDGVNVGDFPTFSARFELETQGDTLIARSSRIGLGEVALQNVRAQFGISEGRVEADVTSVVGSDGRIHFSGDARIADEPDVNIRTAFSDLPVRDVYSLVADTTDGADAPDFLTATTLASGTTGLQVRGNDIRPTDTEISVFDTARATNRVNLAVDAREDGYDGTIGVKRDGIDLDATFDLRSASIDSIAADVDMRLNGVDYAFDLMVGGERAISIVEERGSRVNIGFMEDGGFEVRAQLAGLALPRIPGISVSDDPATVSGRLIADVVALDAWRADIRELSVEGLRVGDRPVSGTLSGRLDAGGGIIEELSVRDDYGSVSAAGTVSYEIGRPFTGRVNLVADGESEDERYELDLGYDGEEVDGRVRLRSSPLERFEFETLAGGLDADATVTGTPDDLEVSAGLSLVDARFDEEEVSGELTLDYADNRVAVSGIEGSYVAAGVSDGVGAIDLESGAFNVSGEIDGVRGDERFETAFDLDGDLEPENGLVATDIAALPFTAQLELEDLPIESDLPTVWRLDLSRDADGTVRVSGGPGESIAAVVDENGRFSLSLTAPLPFSVDAEGMLSATEIEANLTRVSLDVSRVPELFDFGDFRIVSGTASGSLRMTGPIFDPDFFGTVRANDVVSELNLLEEQIGPADGFIVFSEKEISIQPLRTRVGDAEAAFSGTFLLSRWDVQQFDLAVDTVGEIGPRVVYDFGTLEVDGFARGSLRIRQAGDDVRVEGTVVAHNTEITLSEIEDGDTGPPDPEEDNLIFDLTVELGRSVEFLWPTRQLPVLRAVAQRGDEVEIQGESQQELFSVVGDVGMQGGQLFYFDRTFLISEGLIRFNETQDDVDPRLTVRAETRDIGPDGPVRISLVADESRLSDLAVRVVSDPPLPQEEVLALLGSGVFSSDEDGLIDLSGAVLLGSDLVSQFGVIRTVESSIRNALQLDLFTVRTQLFQNLVREVINEPGGIEEAPDPSLGRYFDNTTMFLGRSLGPDVFLELLVQLRMDDPFADAERQFANLEVDSELSVGFETPYFDIEWGFQPRNPEQLFVPDNRFTLSWGFSY
ncbi:MAG: translocation/assembly module TamB domain-containing protein [Spirochaetales bacterium]